MNKNTASGISTYKRLMVMVKPYWPAFLVTIVGNILYSSVDSCATYLFKPLLDKGFIGRDVHFLHILPLIVLGLFLVRGLASIATTYAMGWIGQNVIYTFRRLIFDHLLCLPAKEFDETSSGQLLGKITYNVDQLTTVASQTLTTFVRQGALTIGLLTVMFIASWRLTLLIFLILPFVIIIVRYASGRFRLLSKRIQEGMGNVTHTAEETILGYREVRIFGAQDEQTRRFDHLIRYNLKQQMKKILTDAVSTPIVQFFGAIVLALFIYIAFHGGISLSAGSFVTLFSAMLMILNPIKNLTRLNNQIQTGIAAAESVFELLDKPTEVDDGKQILDKCEGHIRFDKVSFGYSDENGPVLENVSLDIARGKTVALVGRSGGGKSTMVSLLARFYTPSHGHILFDQTDIQTLQLENVRAHISIVSQHVNLFDDSIRNNIAFGQPRDLEDEVVIRAAKAAHAWEFIEDLPHGLKTMIGENGLKLSGGQRQRIAIARALIKDAPILIMDEATSALDNESEKAVQSALETLKQDRTTIVIAHRLSTIENADQIVVMDKGRIIEQGDHGELLDKNGLYAELYRSNSLG